MNNNELLQAAEKQFPIVAEAEYNGYYDFRSHVSYYEYKRLQTLKQYGFIAGANWLSNQQEVPKNTNVSNMLK